MNEPYEKPDTSEDESNNNSMGETFCVDCEACCYGILHPPHTSPNCVFDDSLQQYRLILNKVQIDLKNKDLLINELRDQHIKMETYCRSSLQEIQNITSRYENTVQELENLKKQYEALSEQKLEKRNSNDSTLESLLKTEVQRWNKENMEIQSQMQSMNSDIQRLIQLVMNESKKTADNGSRNQVDPIEQLVTNQSAILTLLASKVEGSVNATKSTNEISNTKLKQNAQRTDSSGADLMEGNSTEKYQELEIKETQTEQHINELHNSLEIIKEVKTSQNQSRPPPKSNFEQKLCSVNCEPKRKICTDSLKDEAEITSDIDIGSKVPENSGTNNINQDVMTDGNNTKQPNERESTTELTEPLKTPITKKCYCRDSQISAEYTEKKEVFSNEEPNIAKRAGGTDNGAEKESEISDIRSEGAEEYTKWQDASEHNSNLSNEPLINEDNTKLPDCCRIQTKIDANEVIIEIAKPNIPVFSQKPPDINDTMLKSSSIEPVDTQSPEMKNDVLDIESRASNAEKIDDPSSIRDGNGEPSLKDEYTNSSNLAQQAEEDGSINPPVVESEHDVLDITLRHSSQMKVEIEKESQPTSLTNSLIEDNDMRIENSNEHLIQENTVKNNDIEHECHEEPECCKIDESQSPSELPKCCEPYDEMIDRMAENSNENEELLPIKNNSTEELRPKSSNSSEKKDAETEEKSLTQEEIFEEVQPIQNINLVEQTPTFHHETKVDSSNEPDMLPFLKEFLSTVTTEIENIKISIEKHDSILQDLNKYIQNDTPNFFHDNAELLNKIQLTVKNLPNLICAGSVFKEIKNKLTEIDQIMVNMQSLINDLNNRFKSGEPAENKKMDTKAEIESFKLNIISEIEKNILNELLDKMKSLEKYIGCCSITAGDEKPIDDRIIAKCICKSKKATDIAKNNCCPKRKDGTKSYKKE